MKHLLDKLEATKLDNRIRLGIMSILMVNDWVDFGTFKEMLGLTDGNLASHIKVLEGEGYVEMRKQFVGRKPQTLYTVTVAGRKAFSDHLAALEALLKSGGGSIFFELKLCISKHFLNFTFYESIFIQSIHTRRFLSAVRPMGQGIAGHQTVVHRLYRAHPAHSQRHDR